MVTANQLVEPPLQVRVAGRGVVAVDGEALGDGGAGAEAPDVRERVGEAAAPVGDERADGLAGSRAANRQTVKKRISVATDL